MAVENMEIHKSPGIDQIPEKLIKQGLGQSFPEITTLINSIWNRKDLLEDWKDSLILPISQKSQKTECINYKGIPLLSIM